MCVCEGWGGMGRGWAEAPSLAFLLQLQLPFTCLLNPRSFPLPVSTDVTPPPSKASLPRGCEILSSFSSPSPSPLLLSPLAFQQLIQLLITLKLLSLRGGRQTPPRSIQAAQAQIRDADALFITAANLDRIYIFHSYLKRNLKKKKSF